MSSSISSRKAHRSLILLLAVTVMGMSGCAGIETVAAWERGYLAEAGMQWDASQQEARFKAHVYTSKESSSGGNGAAGGGCGCN